MERALVSTVSTGPTCVNITSGFSNRRVTCISPTQTISHMTGFHQSNLIPLKALAHISHNIVHKYVITWEWHVTAMCHILKVFFPNPFFCLYLLPSNETKLNEITLTQAHAHMDASPSVRTVATICCHIGTAQSVRCVLSNYICAAITALWFVLLPYAYGWFLNDKPCDSGLM